MSDAEPRKLFSVQRFDKPAKFYINSAPAHKEYPTVHIPLEKANKVALGNDDNLNKRVINQYVHPAVCELSVGYGTDHPCSAECLEYNAYAYS